MKTKFLLVACLLAGALQAQNLTGPAIQRYFNPVRRNLEASADVMPAEKYSFRLTEGQRTFAEWLNHSTQRNYTDCALLRGENPPEAVKTVEGLKTKAEVSAALKDSFAYCEGAMEKMTDQSVAASPQIATAYLHVLVHSNEIYGNIVGYLRASGIVPPSSAGRGGGQKK